MPLTPHGAAAGFVEAAVLTDIQILRRDFKAEFGVGETIALVREFKYAAACWMMRDELEALLPEHLQGTAQTTLERARLVCGLAPEMPNRYGGQVEG